MCVLLKRFVRNSASMEDVVWDQTNAHVLMVSLATAVSKVTRLKMWLFNVSVITFLFIVTAFLDLKRK